MADDFDPYADCECNHGRHTHVFYTGACGLCECAAVRQPSDPHPKENDHD